MCIGYRNSNLYPESLWAVEVEFLKVGSRAGRAAQGPERPGVGVAVRSPIINNK